MTVEENMAKGRCAIREIIKNHSEVKCAMERQEIGSIDFVWGQEGSEERKYKDGFGISKILLKHGLDAIDKIPEVIAKGKYEQSPYNDRVYFILNDYRAVVRLSWNWQKRTWLVTNFIDKKIKNSDDADAFVRSTPTAGNTISSPEQSP